MSTKQFVLNKICSHLTRNTTREDDQFLPRCDHGFINTKFKMNENAYNYGQDFASFQGSQELAYGHTATKDHPSLTRHAARLF